MNGKILMFFNIYCIFRFPKYINLFNEIKMFFLVENFEISLDQLLLLLIQILSFEIFLAYYLLTKLDMF